MRRVQVVRRAARRPMSVDEPVEATAATPSETSLRRRRVARDADVADTLARIDDVTTA